MLIDKSKFLLLVATISAAGTGCILVAGDSEDDGIGGSSSTSTTSSSTSSKSSTNGSTGTGSGACLDDTGTPDACSSECEGFTTCNILPDLHAGVAADAVACLNALDPATCGMSMDAYDNCVLTSLSKGCEYAAETAPICTEIAVTFCGVADDADWQTQCQIRLDGLTAAGRTEVKDCMEANCASGMQLDECMVTLFN